MRTSSSNVFKHVNYEPLQEWTMVHRVYQPAHNALKAELRVLDDKRQRILHAISAIEALPEPDAEEMTAPVAGDGALTTEKSPSYLEAAESVLKSAGHVMHIDELARMFAARGWYADKDFHDNRSHRNSLIGSLDRRARSGEVFFKPEPATYGLVEWKLNQQGTIEGMNGNG